MTADAPIGAMTYVADLAAMVTVASDSTVSRTALKAQGVRVVLFAFDAGQELTEHTAAVPVLLQVVSGRMRVGAAGESVDLGPGSLIHLTARLPHTVLALEPSQLQLTMLDPRAT
ncbi:MAG: cupin domain-containing protein [Actinomycetes bacterium]